MNAALKVFLDKMGITIINPVLKSHNSTDVIGWHCRVTSFINSDINTVNKYFNDNKDYHTSSIKELWPDLFIYKN